MVKALIDQVESGMQAILDGRFHDIDIVALESATTVLESDPVASYEKLHDVLSRNARVITAARHGMQSARNAMQSALGEVLDIYDQNGHREPIQRSGKNIRVKF